MKCAAVYMSVLVLAGWACAVAGPTRPSLPGTIVRTYGTPRGYKPAVSTLRLDESIAKEMETKPAPFVVTEKPEQHAGQPAWLLFAAAATLAFAGTGMVLLTVRTNMQKKQIVSGHSAAPAVVRHMAIGVPLVEEEDDTVVPFVDDELISEEDGDVLEVAQQYRRGRGEVELAMRMRTTQSSPLSIPERIRQAGDKGKKTETIAMAKKLGIGKGELALAVRLNQVRKSARRAEEVV